MTQEQTKKGEAAGQDLVSAPFYSYHHFTKHTVAKLMSYQHRLDWANQPDPFRTYKGAARIVLPRAIKVSSLRYFAALEAMLAGQGIGSRGVIPPPEPADLSLLSNLLFYSMSISAWKQLAGTGERWSLRANPSSGNLHPTETHLLLHAVDGAEDGAYHYFVPEHALEQRATGHLAKPIWQALTGEADTPPVVICLTSIFWREAWKYRDRGYRYCQHDMGHALAAVMLSAAILGWRARIIAEFPDGDLARSLDLVAAGEQPALVIGLQPGLQVQTKATAKQPRDEKWIGEQFQFVGQANALSRELVEYKSIDFVHAATCLSATSWSESSVKELPAAGERPSDMEACDAEKEAVYTPDPDVIERSVNWVVRKRRSAIDLDGRQHMKVAALETLLVSATRGFAADFQRPTPWQSDSPTPGHHLIHLYLYVHRVDGLPPGIYYFDRISRHLVPLVHADEGDAAKYASCFQDIAADGCFAISMVADFNTAYQLYGDRGYRYVHFEAGLIGQWLYLGATALGLESTGIGCFLDDVVNNLLALPPGLECVYNFTVGRAVFDPRLTTLPAYDFPDPALA